jgi:hypothetical protein
MYEYYVKQIIFSQIFVVDRIAVPGLALYLEICLKNAGKNSSANVVGSFCPLYISSQYLRTINNLIILSCTMYIL